MQIGEPLVYPVSSSFPYSRLPRDMFDEVAQEVRQTLRVRARDTVHIGVGTRLHSLCRVLVNAVYPTHWQRHPGQWLDVPL